jgi:hypothetical protein
MVDVGFTSKYNPVGWKATCVSKQVYCDIIGIVGDMFVPMTLDTSANAYVCDSVLKMSDIYPAMPDGGSISMANWFCPPVNRAYITYVVGGITYYLSLQPVSDYKRTYFETTLTTPNTMIGLASRYRPALKEYTTDGDVVVATYVYQDTVITTSGYPYQSQIELPSGTNTTATQALGSVTFYSIAPNPQIASTPAHFWGATYSSCTYLANLPLADREYKRFGVCKKGLNVCPSYYTTVEYTGITTEFIGYSKSPDVPTSATTTWSDHPWEGPWGKVTYSGLNFLMYFNDQYISIDTGLSPHKTGTARQNFKIVESTSNARRLYSLENIYSAENSRYWSVIRKIKIDIPPKNTSEYLYPDCWSYNGSRWVSTPITDFTWESDYGWVGVNVDILTGEYHSYVGATINSDAIFREGIYLQDYGVAEIDTNNILNFYKWPDRLTLVASVQITGNKIWDSAQYSRIESQSATQPATKHLFTLAFTGGIAHFFVDNLDLKTGTATYFPFKIKKSDGSQTNLIRTWACVADISSNGMFHRGLYNDGFVPATQI